MDSTAGVLEEVPERTLDQTESPGVVLDKPLLLGEPLRLVQHPSCEENGLTALHVEFLPFTSYLTLGKPL